MQLQKLVWLFLLKASFALSESEEVKQVTVTKTNYVTPYCFQQHLKTITNEENHTTGIPLVIVYANPEDPIASESAGYAPAFQSQATSSSHYSCTTYTTVVKGSTVVSTKTYYDDATALADSDDSTVSTKGSTKSSTKVSTKSSTKSTDSESDSTLTNQCSVCEQVSLIESASTTHSSTIYSANSTQPVTVTTQSDGLPAATESDPLVTASTITTGSTISIATTFDLSLALNSTDSTYGVSLSTNSSSVAPSTVLTSSIDPQSLFLSSGFITSTITSSTAASDPADSSKVASSSADPSNTYLTLAAADPHTTTYSSDPASSSGLSYSFDFKYTNSSSVYSSSLLSSSYAVSSSSSSIVLSSAESSSSSLFSSSAASSTESSSSAVSSSESSSAVTSSSSEVSSSSSSSSSEVESSSTSSGTMLTIRSVPTCHTISDLFQAIDTANPSKYYTAGKLPLAIPDGIESDVPIGTNSFYANLFLGEQTSMVWTYPYGFYWAKDSKYGIAVQHTDTDSRVWGETNSNGAASYYYNPILLGEIIFSATTLTLSNNYLNMTDMKPMSATVRLSPDGYTSSNYIEIPLVHGMGFATSIYHGDLIARLSTVYAFTSLVQETVASSNGNLLKYRVTLNLGAEWLLFVTLPSKDSSFTMKVSDGVIVASKAVDGLIIQAAFAPDDTSLDNYYYESAGQYVTGALIEGSISCTSASYKFDYLTGGSSIAGKPIVFALPHHLETLDSSVTTQSTGIELASTDKGTMNAFLVDELSFTETINNEIQFLPWVLGMGTTATFSEEQLELIYETALDEISNVDIALTILAVGSTYSMGKLADKYAFILYVLNDIIKDTDTAASLLESLKDYYSTWLANTALTYTLMHDTRWGGVTSTANNDGDTGLDYGSGYYNDHHFHYGYHIHAAALIGHVDKEQGGTWAEENKEQLNMLVRDVANPSEDDPYFPVFRLFDWFQGHSWAKGLFSSGDGKDEESSSEDYHFYYGMKLWGNVIGDNAMEARGDLILKIMSRSMNLYFLYSDDNTVEPSKIIPNKVSGILFDNKIAYTTYFGTNTEYIHGIHMLPITPASGLIRGATFVEEEWTSIISGIIDSVSSGWTGILRLNEALYDASTSYSFFSSDSFSSSYLDDGQSRTWSLTFSAAVANADL